ncbi:MAG: dTMP kinase [Acidobacteriota bacterium]
MTRGRFVTFEGLDGSGKSTHLLRAADWLRARRAEVETTQEPGGTNLGRAIRQLVLDPREAAPDPRVEALLMFADRRHHLVERIEPVLARGAHVLCDRFTDSSVAYQGGGRRLGADWILALDRLATDGRRPDATLLFDLPAEAARARGARSGRKRGEGPDRIDAESLDFYTRVRDAFLTAAAEEPERFHVIDSAGAPETTWIQVEIVLKQLFPEEASA